MHFLDRKKSVDRTGDVEWPSPIRVGVPRWDAVRSHLPQSYREAKTCFSWFMLKKGLTARFFLVKKRVIRSQPHNPFFYQKKTGCLRTVPLCLSRWFQPINAFVSSCSCAPFLAVLAILYQKKTGCLRTARFFTEKKWVVTCF